MIMVHSRVSPGVRDDQGGISIRRSDGPTTRVVISSPTAGVVQFVLNRIDGPVTGDVTMPEFLL